MVSKDMEFPEMHFLVRTEFLVRQGAEKKAGFMKSQGAFRKNKFPSWKEKVPRSQGSSS